MLILFLAATIAQARSVTIETRTRETARELVSVSACTPYTVTGRAPYTTWGAAVTERVNQETYLVEVTQESYWGDRTERLIPGSEKTVTKIENSQKEFWGKRAEAECDAYRTSAAR